jgi:hypothetical protein
MPELPNPKHEKFAQNIARGLSPTEAYISAGYSRKGAHASAARLLHNATICTRLQALRSAMTASFLQLAITERDQRLIALQECWDGLRQARLAFAVGDFAPAVRTGFVCRRIRWVGGKDGREVEEYEINTALIESMNLNPAVRRPPRPVRHLPPMISNCGADHLLGDERFFCNRLQPTVRWPLRGPQLPDLG